MKNRELITDIPELNDGDIVQVSDTYNRHSVMSWAWWAMLILGPPRACRYAGWAFCRKESDPYAVIPSNRRGLFERRQVQRFVVRKG